MAKLIEKNTSIFMAKLIDFEGSIKSIMISHRVPCGNKQTMLIRGASRSVLGTALFIPMLGIQLDCGRKVTWAKDIVQMYITHGHLDHCSDFPLVVSYVATRQHAGHITVYAPDVIVPRLFQYERAAVELNTNSEEGEGEEELTGDFDLIGVHTGDDSPEISFLGGKRKKTVWRVIVMESTHTVPCLSYAFYEVGKCLNPNYSPEDVPRLRHRGVEDINVERLIPRFLFCGDTGPQFLQNYADTIKTFPLVIIECTYLDGPVEKAVTRGHLHLDHIVEFATDAPNTHFELIHFSLRYKTDEAIRGPIEETGPTNLHAFI